MSQTSKKLAGPPGREARLSIEVTQRCNSSCLHCFAGAGPSGDNEIPYEVVKNIIREGALNGYRHLHLTGGEPLLYETIVGTVDTAARLGYESILLNTNGALLDRPLCRELARHTALTLSLSLEVNESLHDRLRGRGTYREALKGMEAGLDAGVNLIVFTLACRSSLPDLPRFVDDLMTRFPGIAFLTLNRLCPPTRDHPRLANEYVSPEDFLKLVRIVSLLNAIGRHVEVMNEPLVNAASQKLAVPAVPVSRALDYPGDLMVKADLSIVPSHTSNACCGVYTPGAIEHCWLNSRYRRAVAPDTNVCPVCRHVDLCRANGLQRPLGVWGGIQADKPYCASVLDFAINAIAC
jgi:MoaA/NifB/PqqE/SkfB family radical SAM enzyme